MRAVALLGLHAPEEVVRRFNLPGVNIFSGNELDPTDRPDAVLIFGGDGTIHRHLAGLALKRVPTLVVPIGSGNDFAHSIGIDSVARSLSAWRRFCTQGNNARAIDLGTIQSLKNSLPGLNSEASSTAATSEPQAEQGDPWYADLPETLHFVPDGRRRDLPQMGRRIMQSQLRRASDAEREIARTTFFCCIAGTGLDAAVNRVAMKQSRWLRGHGGYLVALLQTLGSFRPPHITVSIERDGAWQTAIDESGFLVAAGNGPQYGHGMRLTHQARMDDGLLDLCFVRRVGKMRLLRLIRTVYSGEHIRMNEVEYCRAERVRIASEPVSEIFADGEYVCPTPLEIGVARAALRVIVPA